MARGAALTLPEALQLALHGRTQDEVAALIGASARSIRRWKAGTHAPTKKHLSSLLSLSRTVRRARIAKGAPPLPVPPVPIKKRVPRIVEKYLKDIGQVRLTRTMVTQLFYDTRGYTRAQIVALMEYLQSQRKEVRFFLKMPAVSETGLRYRNRTGSTAWISLYGANRAMLDRRVLRALQVGESITSIAVNEDPLAPR